MTRYENKETSAKETSFNFSILALVKAATSWGKNCLNPKFQGNLTFVLDLARGKGGGGEGES